MSAVIVIFGISTVLFTLVVTGYLYSIPASQDTGYLLKPNLLWLNTLILLFVTYFFHKITSDLKKDKSEKIKSNLLLIGFLSYLFLSNTIFCPFFKFASITLSTLISYVPDGIALKGALL